ncbi:MAG: hypothetical protein ACOY0T_15225 [Myxococcota bacterium]
MAAHAATRSARGNPPADAPIHGQPATPRPSAAARALNLAIPVVIGGVAAGMAKGPAAAAGSEGAEIASILEGGAARGTGRAASNPRVGRFDVEHAGPRGFDIAREGAFRNAGDLGPNTQRMFDPETGTLIGEMSANSKQGWRIDNDHFNWWDWSGGKKGQGGRYGHEFFPPEQAGPHSRHIGYAQWE